jgi:hypothetical protein
MRDLANQALGNSLGYRFSAWLLRPYLDLGPCQVGPTHAKSVDAGWQAYADPDRPFFLPQRALSPGFRAQLAEQAGAHYAVSDPRDLAEDLRTDRWRKLCQDLELWPELSSARKCRLGALLHSMCLYAPLLEAIPEDGSGASDADPCAAQLAFCRASAKFMLDLPKRGAGYESKTMSPFESIANDDRTDGPVRFNATAMVFVQKAKARASLAELDDWSKRLESAFAAVEGGENRFTVQLFRTRFYRGMGFLPQAAGDRDAMIRTMDIAERQARDLAPTTAAEQILFRENLHAVLESRTKEALWLNDLDLAASRAAELTRIDPTIQKRGLNLVRCITFRKTGRGPPKHMSLRRCWARRRVQSADTWRAFASVNWVWIFWPLSFSRRPSKSIRPEYHPVRRYLICRTSRSSTHLNNGPARI